MSDELNVKISEIKAKFIKNEAKMVDKYFGNGDGSINKDEAEKLAQVLSGDLKEKKNQKKLEKESDEVKAIFGFTSTKPATTEAEAPKAPKAEAPKAPKAEEAQEVPDLLKDFNGLDAEHKAVMDAYKKARGFDPENGGRLEGVPEKTVKAAYEEVEAQFKDKKYKKALKDLEDYAKHVDAHFVAKAAIKDSNATTSKEVKADAEKALEDRNNGKMDKWEKHALHNTDRKITKRVLSWASGRNSQIKDLRKGVAAGNNAAEVLKEHYSEAQITDALGKKSPLSVKALADAGLIAKDENGNYDIKALSEAVKRGIGSDNTANREQHKGESELERVKDELRNDGINVGKISDKEIKRVIRFCGYKVQNKNYASTVYDTIVGAALAGGATATAVATNPYNVVKVPIDVQQKVNVPINLGEVSFAEEFMQKAAQDEALQKLLAETGGSITSAGAEILITVEQLANLEPVVEFSKRILTTSMKGALIGAGLGLLQGLMSYGPSEKGLFETTLDCTTYEGLSRIIDGRVADGILTKEQGLALKLLATEFIQTEKAADGTEKAMTEDVNGKCEIVIDCEGFMKKLREAAGNSKLNAVELDAVARNYKNPFEVEKMDKKDCNESVQEEEPVVKEETVVKEEPVVKEKPVVQPKYYDSGYQEVKRTDKFEAWADFATRYDCLEGDFNPKFKLNYNTSTKTFNPNSYARTMMKVMQAVTDNNYDLERLQKLTEAAERGDFATLKAEKDFDYKLYRALRGNKATHTFAFDRQKVPTITRVDGQNQTITCEPRKAPQYKSTVSGTSTAIRTTIGGEDSGFVKSEDGKIDVKVNNKPDYEKAKKAAEEAGYEVRK